MASRPPGSTADLIDTILRLEAEDIRLQADLLATGEALDMLTKHPSLSTKFVLANLGTRKAFWHGLLLAKAHKKPRRASTKPKSAAG